MRTRIWKAASASALALAAVMGTSAGAATAATPGTSLGPYEYLYECLGAGRQGVQNGEWTGYECEGDYPAYYIVPEYD